MNRRNQLRRSSVLRATFLHESSSSDEDWRNSLLEDKDVDHVEVSASGFTAAADDSATNKSESERVEVDASAHRNCNSIAASSRNVTKSCSESNSDKYNVSDSGHSSSRSSGCSSYSSTSRSSKSFYNFNRAASVANLSASEAEDLSPHELAARVALSVKSNFAKKLPSTLHDNCVSSSYKDCVAPYKTNEIVLGPLLGSGEFSHVYEIKAFRPEASLLEEGGGSTSSLTQDEIDTRQYMKRRERYHDTKRACYAVKHLRPQLLEKYGKLEYAQSASDLALEAEFLANLSHPNIIKLRGISFAGAQGFENGPKGYFLIIDRLNETLDQRIKRWKKDKKKGGGLASSWKAKRLLTGRLRSSFQDGSSSGVENSNNSNAELRGDVKLFDFGLAKIMPKNGDPYEDKFEMSGAGSPRYMSPEVLADPPEEYNMKADVYTFGIVLWQIFSLEIPYFHIKTRDGLVEFVVEQDGRPEINEQWPEPIKRALQQSFDPDIDKRPSTQLFYNVLRFQLLKLRDGDGTKLTDAFITRRRSLRSMRHLNCNDDDDDDNDGDDGNNRHTVSQEKFPLRVRNTIMSHVKPSQHAAAAHSNGDGHTASAQPQRRMRNKLRDKFRLSIKREE
ncbi:hypothetical protein ACHAXR_008973 [Thalassiosira sp. AJA248-18]